MEQEWRRHVQAFLAFKSEQLRKSLSLGLFRRGRVTLWTSMTTKWPESLSCSPTTMTGCNRQGNPFFIHFARGAMRTRHPQRDRQHQEVTLNQLLTWHWRSFEGKRRIRRNEGDERQGWKARFFPSTRVCLQQSYSPGDGESVPRESVLILTSRRVLWFISKKKIPDACRRQWFDCTDQN